MARDGARSAIERCPRRPGGCRGSRNHPAQPGGGGRAPALSRALGTGALATIRTRLRDECWRCKAHRKVNDRSWPRTPIVPLPASTTVRTDSAGQSHERRLIHPTGDVELIHQMRHSIRRSSHRRGQSLVEFALVLPMLLLLVGRQLFSTGILIATSHTLTKIGRDLGRWAATRMPQTASTWDWARHSPMAQRAHAIAVGVEPHGLYDRYTMGDEFPLLRLWRHAGDAAEHGGRRGCVVRSKWRTCPPEDSTTAVFVTVRLAHRAPVVLPGLGYLAGIGTL